MFRIWLLRSTLIITLDKGRCVVFWDGSDDGWQLAVERHGIAERTDLCVLAEEKVEPGLHWVALGPREEE